MNGPLLHLALNHIPVVVPPFIALLFSVALWRRSRELAEAGLWGLVIVAVLTTLAFKTGGPAAKAMRGIPGVERSVIRDHSHAADKGFWGMELLGILGLFGLWRLRQSGVTSARLSAASLIGTLAISGWMAWVAHLGGLIRHPEIASDYQPAAATNTEPTPSH